MRKLLLALMVLPVTAALLQAVGPPLDSLVVSAPGRNDYPDAAAVVVFDRRTVNLTADGGEQLQVELLVKILDKTAVDYWKSQTIPFNAERDTVIIEAARTRLPDGTWVEPEPDAVSVGPVVPRTADFSRLQRWTISFAGVESGSAIYLAYRVEAKPGARRTEKPYAGGTEYFGGADPTIEKQFIIRADSGRFIQYRVERGAAEPVVSRFEGRTQYAWRTTDLPRVDLEPGMVSPPFLLPQVHWTCFRDWDDLALFVTHHFWDGVDAAESAVEGYARLTPSSLHGRPALMQATLWVQQSIRLISLPLGSAGYVPHSADRVWQNRYGDPLDKAVLLTALLRAYGFAPIPALVPGQRRPFSDLPVLQQFEHVILMVPFGSDTLWLDPTAEDYAPDELPIRNTYGQACLLTAGLPMLIAVPSRPPARRGAVTELRATLSAGGELAGSFICRPQGDAAARARAMLKSRSTQELNDYAMRCADTIGRGGLAMDLTTTDLTDVAKPVTVRLDFAVPGYAAVNKRRLQLEFPDVPFEFGRPAFSPVMQDVIYPVELPDRARFNYSCVISLPADYRIAQLPLPVIIENPYFHAEITVRVTESALHWELTVEIKAEMLPVADYPAIAAAYQSLSEPRQRQVLLEQR